MILKSHKPKMSKIDLNIRKVVYICAFLKEIEYQQITEISSFNYSLYSLSKKEKKHSKD